MEEKPIRLKFEDAETIRVALETAIKFNYEKNC